MSTDPLWQRYVDCICPCESVGIALDVSRMDFPDGLLADAPEALTRAFDDMDALERGEIANPDEDRMVGHYWLRAPRLSPSKEIRYAIESVQARIKSFAADVHSGKITPSPGGGKEFRNVLLIGIGGSALGPQLLHHALGRPDDPMRFLFLDNTDPDGFDRIFAELGRDGLGRTLVLVISKSGGTRETRNGMIETAAAFQSAGLQFPRHAVAVTCEQSKLHAQCQKEGWITWFPIWDWVGGRTSVTSAVGLLPAALTGIDVDALLRGAALMDELTRLRDLSRNPAAVMALLWRYMAQARGLRDMVVIPYKDRLELFSRYLQQLVMESLGKDRTTDGQPVTEGLTVYGNKGSTDQHAYVQQLREGLANFFVTFIEVLEQRSGNGLAVAGDATGDWVSSGDYLHGFLMGTRQALHENHRPSIMLTVDRISPESLGALIALFERTVGLYASLAGINAYHQPGVEAGKKAAEAFIALQQQVMAALRHRAGAPATAEQIAVALDESARTEWVYKSLQYLAADPERSVHCDRNLDPRRTTFALTPSA